MVRPLKPGRSEGRSETNELDKATAAVTGRITVSCLVEDHHSNGKGNDHQLSLARYCTWDVLMQVLKYRPLIYPKFFFQIHGKILKKIATHSSKHSERKAC